MTPIDRNPLHIWRRVAAIAVDAVVLFLIPMLWWHWSEWARYTSTFGRQVPATIAMPVMALMPLTVVWLEGVAGRSLGMKLLGLRVRTAEGVSPSRFRTFARSILKWSPIWVGPAVWIIDAFADTTRADDFTNDQLLSRTLDLAEHLPPAGAKFIWVANVSLRGMNWGVIPLAILATGCVLILLPGRRTLLDWMTGTRMVDGKSE